MAETKYVCYLTTFDNIYDPSEDFVKWFNEDKRLGYNCSAYLARVIDAFKEAGVYGTALPGDDQLTDSEAEAMTEIAIDAIIANDFTNNYKKVKKELKNDEKSQTA